MLAMAWKMAARVVARQARSRIALVAFGAVGLLRLSLRSSWSCWRRPLSSSAGSVPDERSPMSQGDRLIELALHFALMSLVAVGGGNAGPARDAAPRRRDASLDDRQRVRQLFAIARGLARAQTS